MKKLFITLLTVLFLTVPLPGLTKRVYKQAESGYHYSFPQDHFSHDSYKTEWWYYTGHLTASDGSTYGYQLTFFRTALDVENKIENSFWQVNDLHMAHFCLSDINKNTFMANHRIRREGLGIAGAEKKQFKVWNQNWSTSKNGDSHHLMAKDGNYSIDLELNETKQPVIQGQKGISRKAFAPGCASHYYSITRMNTKGSITVDGKKLNVQGQSWMDHEFGSNQLTKDQIGWDWFSIQLDDNRELMFYLMRLNSGGYDPVSSGTIIDSDGSSKHLTAKDFSITPTGTWKSNKTQAVYPSGWKIALNSESLELFIVPKIKNQELVKGEGNPVSYWEGACNVTGKLKEKSIKGQSYVELTGYAEQFTEKI